MQYNIHTAQQVQQLNTVNNMQNTTQHAKIAAMLQQLGAALVENGFVLKSSDTSKVDSVWNKEYEKETRIYTGSAQLKTSGEGWWDAPPNKKVEVTGITLTAYLDANKADATAFYRVNVQHKDKEKNYMLYSDKGISAGMCKLLNNKQVHFTEQGMQKEYQMSMEVYSE